MAEVIDMNDVSEAVCGCCEGIEHITPEQTANRPGLDALTYRIGTHATFLETMKARLSEMSAGDVIPLRGLTTRDADDPAIAMLDSWATVADVLTFYQERIANEGYLRSALERRSVLNLARLVGYKLRPGVAATVYLAYTIDDKHKEPVEIPIGARAQSVPVAGELPQTFEAVEKLDARSAWNVLKPRLARPQTEAGIVGSVRAPAPRVYLKGIATNLKANDPVLIDLGDGSPKFTRVQTVAPDLPANRTLVTLRAWPGLSQTGLLTQQKPEEAQQQEAVAKQLAEVRAIAERYLTLEVEQRGVSVKSDMYKRVANKLRDLGASRELTEAAYLAKLDHDVLPSVMQEEKVAGDSARYVNLKPWVSALVSELQALSQRGRTARAERLARNFALAISAPPVAPSAETVGVATRANPITLFRKGDDVLTQTMTGLTKAATVPPPNEKQFTRRGERTFQKQADAGVQMATVFDARLGESLPVAVANAKAASDNPIRFYALRTTARPFGHNAPLKTTLVGSDTKSIAYSEWDIDKPLNETQGSNVNAPHTSRVISLDAEYALSPDSWIVFENDLKTQDPFNMSGISGRITHEAVAGYSLSGKSTRLRFADGDNAQTRTGIQTAPTGSARNAPLTPVRATSVHLQSELLELAEEPITNAICGGDNDLIELDGLYNDLKSGRWLIVSGERTDITSISTTTDERVSGVRSSELVMLAEVIHTVEELHPSTGVRGSSYYQTVIALPGDRTHTYIRLATQLEYCYARDTATIYGNVVKATHGETRHESLGNGDGSKAMQSFGLKQKPLTHVPAPTPAGADSTLKVFVNDVEWHETDGLAGLAPTDRAFITQTDDEDKTAVTFGNGKTGARLPTGSDNVKATYRNGIGKVGNVKAGQISLLMSRPLGVKEVINPMRASGGADRETRDQARRNAPLAVMALDRLVSVQDYEDFARVFAGIGKTSAALLTDGQQELLHITIAGADDIPIEPSSDLYRNLVRALRQFGEPHQALQVAVRELALLVVSARIKPHPDYVWEPLVAKVRARLLDAFSFDKRELGQDAMLSEVVAVAQTVPGVAFVDVDVFGSVAEKTVDGKRPRTPQELSAEVEKLFVAHQAGQSLPTNQKTQPMQRVVANMAESKGGATRPAQIAFLSAGVPDTLILNRI